MNMAAVLHELGQAPRFESFSDPVAGDGEVMVQVRAASLKPVDKQMASGTHYASFRQLPAVCGTDGVGQFEDGARVFFGGPRHPYGSMAQRTVAPRIFCFPVPDGVDDDTAAALPNPGISAWLSIANRAKLLPGETVLILGATGVTGKLAVQIAKILGAGRVVAAGRSEQTLGELLALGADSIVDLKRPDGEVAEAFARAAGEGGFNVIIDYLWGHPTEVLLGVLTRREFAGATTETRLIQVGETAGPVISLPAAVLRSTALTICGTAGIPSREILDSAYQNVMSHAASGRLRIQTERIPLAEIEKAWQREIPSGCRLVIIP
jgi:NADPH:quinone reductase-like Zn-dependent oxidoreductase